MNKADTNLGFTQKISTSKTCVFISYKKEDQHIAVKLGDFLTNQLCVDIYLDIYDSELREAVSVENDAKIVKSITNGLKLSQILLCVISDKTKLSWWVPYEIGMADNTDIKIASIKTKNIDDFPSFLKTKKTLNTLHELIDFILKNSIYSSLYYSNQQRDILHPQNTGSLNQYFE